MPWGGTDLARLPEEGRAQVRRETVGLVFQDVPPFGEPDALANAAPAAAFAPGPEGPALRERARGWLGRLGLGEAESRRAASLSGGERQRVAVARALAAGGPVLLADEPTASLDRAAAGRLAEDLAGLRGGRTLIAVAHDEALMARMDRRITIEAGRIVEDEGGCPLARPPRGGAGRAGHAPPAPAGPPGRAPRRERLRALGPGRGPRGAGAGAARGQRPGGRPL